MRASLILPTFLSLVLAPIAWASFSDQSLHTVVDESKFAVVARVVEDKIVIAKRGAREKECGAVTRLEVLEDLKGNAPKSLVVGFRFPVVVGRIYFLPVRAGRNNFPNDVTIVGDEEEGLLEDQCGRKMPPLSVNWLMYGEMVETSQQTHNQLKKTKWLAKPIYLLVPNSISLQKFRATDDTTEEWRDVIRHQLRSSGLGLDVVYLDWEQLKSVASVAPPRDRDSGD